MTADHSHGAKMHLCRSLVDRLALRDGHACVRSAPRLLLVPSTCRLRHLHTLASGRLVHLSNLLRLLWSFPLEVHILRTSLLALLISTKTPFNAATTKWTEHVKRSILSHAFLHAHDSLGWQMQRKKGLLFQAFVSCWRAS